MFMQGSGSFFTCTKDGREYIPNGHHGAGVASQETRFHVPQQRGFMFGWD